jgi:hypothetical protein
MQRFVLCNVGDSTLDKNNLHEIKMCTITPKTIINAAKSMVNLPQMRNDTFTQQCKSAFSALPEVCCLLWNKLDQYKMIPTGVDPKHLLWELYLLIVYDTGHDSVHSLGKVDEKTYRKWSELFCGCNVLS